MTANFYSKDIELSVCAKVDWQGDLQRITITFPAGESP